MGRGLAARGERAAAFDGRCIPALGVARRLNIPDIRPPRALIAGRLVRLGATRPFHHRLLAPLRRAQRRDLLRDEADEEDDHQNSTSKTRRFRSSSMDDMPKLYSPTPIRPTRPHSLFNYGIEDIEFTSPLDSIISRPGMASPVNSLVSSPVIVTRSDKTIGQDVALRRLRRWLSK